ncbi:MAG: endonuclease domain-containing protein [Acidimicrobiales bacterium]
MIVGRFAQFGVFSSQLDAFEDWPDELVAAVPGGGHRSAEVRHARRLEAPAAAPLPRTGVNETLVELGAGLAAKARWPGDPRPIPPADLLELALESALRRGLTTLADVHLVAACGARRAGAEVLAEVLARRPVGAPATESYLETRAVQVMRRGGLPDPARQVEIRDGRGGFIARVDFLLGRLVVETDGRATHARDGAFERDRERWSRLAAAGYAVLVFTYEQVERWPGYVVRTIAAAQTRSTNTSRA